MSSTERWILSIVGVMLIALSPMISNSMNRISITGKSTPAETVSFLTHKDGRNITAVFRIDNGPATDCDNVVIEEILRKHYRNGTLKGGKEIESELRSRGIPIKIVEIIEGQPWGIIDAKPIYDGRK